MGRSRFYVGVQTVYRRYDVLPKFQEQDLRTRLGGFPERTTTSTAGCQRCFLLLRTPQNAFMDASGTSTHTHTTLILESIILNRSSRPSTHPFNKQSTEDERGGGDTAVGPCGGRWSTAAVGAVVVAAAAGASLCGDQRSVPCMMDDTRMMHWIDRRTLVSTRMDAHLLSPPLQKKTHTRTQATRCASATC